MAAYESIRGISQRLAKDFDLAIPDNLPLAAQIHLCDILEHGLQTWDRGMPTFLEAIAMSLGFHGDVEQRKKVTDALLKIAESLSDK